MPDFPAKILVVDDNPATLYSTSRVLRSAQWEVVNAATGQQAVDLSTSGVDIIVLDVHLPDIDGFEVCRKIRQNEATARTPVIHLSATFVNDAFKVQGLEAGADGYLTHPVEPPVLIATVNAFLRARRAESEMRKSEAKFKAIYNNAVNGIALLSQDLVYVDVNPSMSQLLLCTPESMIGRPMTEFLPPEYAIEAAAMTEQLREQGAWRGVFPLLRSDGSLCHLEWNMATHSLPDIWLAIVSDITARVEFEREREFLLVSERAARAEAERANRLKDDFLATLSHELRTPLNAIVGWSQLLKMGNLPETDQQEGLDAIERNAQLQAQMIADLLDVARITSGKLRLEMQNIELPVLVESALASTLPAAAEKNIAIAKQLDTSVGAIHGDPARLQQIVWNLVNNAVKFTPPDGQVTVSIRQVDSRVELSVADTGQGIPTELLPFIFERFRQEDASTTRVHGGLGIGLAIVKQLVELHGGTISAHSEGKGRGAKFVVMLPLAAVRKSLGQSSADGANPDKGPVRLDGVRILIVDDDQDARNLLKRVATEAGAEAADASSAAQGLSVIDEFHPQVLVSDLGMPLQDGFAFIEQIRGRGITAEQLPAIALTAFARSEDRRRALRCGFQVHMAKPVDPRELTMVVASLMKSRQSD